MLTGTYADVVLTFVKQLAVITPKVISVWIDGLVIFTAILIYDCKGTTVLRVLRMLFKNGILR